MLEYIACALLGLVMIGCLLYVIVSAEAEEPPSAKRSDIKPWANPATSGAAGKNTNA